jgi:hypothetical protein
MPEENCAKCKNGGHTCMVCGAAIDHPNNKCSTCQIPGWACLEAAQALGDGRRGSTAVPEFANAIACPRTDRLSRVYQARPGRTSAGAAPLVSTR